MPADRIMFTVSALDAIKLTIAEAAALQDLLDLCTDYYEMVEGRPAGSDAAMEEIKSSPAGCNIDDLFCLGLRNNAGKIIGVISALRHHRRLNQWYLGFFMLHPEWRGRHIGRTVYAAFEDWLSHQGADSILLSVVELNKRAERFWQSLGFAFLQLHPSTAIGLRRHCLVEYEKTLPPKHFNRAL